MWYLCVDVIYCTIFGFAVPTRSPREIVNVPVIECEIYRPVENVMVELIYGNAKEIVDVTGSPPHAFACTDLLHLHMRWSYRN